MSISWSDNLMYVDDRIICDNCGKNYARWTYTKIELHDGRIGYVNRCCYVDGGIGGGANLCSKCDKLPLLKLKDNVIKSLCAYENHWNPNNSWSYYQSLYGVDIIHLQNEFSDCQEQCLNGVKCEKFSKCWKYPQYNIHIPDVDWVG